MANGTWTSRRTRGYQLPLAVLFVLAVALVLIGKAQSTLFDRARAHITDWMQPELAVLHRPFDWVSSGWRNLGDIFRTHEENIQLKAENARLKQWQTYAVSLEARVKRYQLLLKAVPDPALTSVLSHVIGRARRPFLETMILDAGSANGVKPGQAVIDSRGMIGRIFLAGEHTSWVILLTDLNSRIPVVVEPGHASAILAGDNARAPALETLAQGVVVHEGDQVVSSGDGGILPPGLPIGTVVADSGGFRVALLADPSATQDAEIVDFKSPVEMPSAAGAKDLPISAAGLPPAMPQPAPVPGNANAPGAMSAPLASGTASAPVKPPAQMRKPNIAAPPSPDTGPADDQ
ncbi:MAG: rod shape-determining protein MreC [Alphaproteobacteria bacterium]|nr:rod shape-determining protein MreC [Alphaproteobacteria bacterium]MBV9695222.1 rod shape-determining protein MreC [Alphaproteobacteria bacterium]